MYYFKETMRSYDSDRMQIIRRVQEQYNEAIDSSLPVGHSKEETTYDNLLLPRVDE